MLVRSGELTKEEASAMLEEDRKQYASVDPELKDRFYQRIAKIEFH